MTVEVPLLPWLTETALGEAEMLKFAGAVKVKLRVEVCVMVFPVPVIVIG